MLVLDLDELEGGAGLVGGGFGGAGVRVFGLTVEPAGGGGGVGGGGDGGSGKGSVGSEESRRRAEERAEGEEGAHCWWWVG